MSDDETNQGTTIKEENSEAEVIIAKGHLQDSESASDNPQHEANKSQDTETIDMLAIKDEKDASTTNVTEKQLEWREVRHPRLPPKTPPRYFVNKSSVVCSKAKGEFRPLKPTRTVNTGAIYGLYTVKNTVSFKLAEIMAYTFSEKPFDSDKHYIFYKDGDQSNCEWDNMVICEDLPALQQLEIARLEKQHPGTRYTVVRNIHDTLTFERYLVSDNGDVYSLIRRCYLKPILHYLGYEEVYMQPGDCSRQSRVKKIGVLVHCVVLRSFTGRRVGDFQITHINGDRLDSSLSNLEYSTRSKLVRRAHENTQKSKKIPEKKSLRPLLPPVTEVTRWKPVGVLPWNGRLYSQYEVSDMGHVRRIGKPKILAQRCNEYGYALVYMRHEKPDMSSDEVTKGRVPESPGPILVSRLVANAFVDGYSEARDIVIHLNGNPQDNRAQNLEWGDRTTSKRSRKSRRVKVSLLDDPAIQKEFPSIAEVQRRLSVLIAYLKLKSGDSVERDVIWDGAKRAALIEML